MQGQYPALSVAQKHLIKKGFIFINNNINDLVSLNLSLEFIHNHDITAKLITYILNIKYETKIYF